MYQACSTKRLFFVERCYPALTSRPFCFEQKCCFFCCATLDGELLFFVERLPRSSLFFDGVRSWFSPGGASFFLMANDGCQLCMQNHFRFFVLEDAMERRWKRCSLTREPHFFESARAVVLPARLTPGLLRSPSAYSPTRSEVVAIVQHHRARAARELRREDGSFPVEHSNRSSIGQD